MFVSAPWFHAELEKDFKIGNSFLPIDKDARKKLLDALGDGNFTYLSIHDGLAVEVVKATNVCGRLVLTRGAERTRALSFRCGTPVNFILTMDGVKKIVCQMESCDGDGL